MQLIAQAREPLAVGGATLRRRVATRAAALDCGFLAVVTALSVVPYVGGLGFYYDDYPVLARMAAAADQSLGGLYHAVRPLTGQRPLQAFVFAVLYRLFGLHPLGFHACNAALLVAVALLLYLVLRELRLPRLLCVAVPLVYSTLPHYATNRFWMDAFQINLSSVFYLLSLYAGLRALRARARALGGWLALALAAVAGSLLAYEVVYPLFALNVVLIWWAGTRATGERWNRRTAAVVAPLVGTIAAVGLVKTALVAEHGQNSYQVGLGSDPVHQLSYLVSGAIKLNVGSYFLAVPYVLWWIVAHRFSAANALVAAACGLLALGYVRRVAIADREGLASPTVWRRLAAAGVAAFVLGYAIFLTNPQILFRSAGIDNRVNAAAALGVAAVLVGAVALLTRRLFAQHRESVFAVAAACVVAGGVFIVATLGSFWTSADTRQRSLVHGVERAAPTLPRRATVVLDGVCPEIGPAVVFADQWDFRAALQLAYHDPALVADVATDSLRAGPRALALRMTFLGAASTRTYPYSRRLLVYDAGAGRLYRLDGRAAATRYVSRVRPAFHCPPQRSFAWGFDPSRRLSLP